MVSARPWNLPMSVVRAHLVLGAALGDQHQLASMMPALPTDPGPARRVFGRLLPKCLRSSAEAHVALELYGILRMYLAEAATEIDHGQRDAALGAGRKIAAVDANARSQASTLLLLRADAG